MSLLYDEEAFDSVPKQEHRRLVRKIEWLWQNRTILTHVQMRQDLNPFYKWRVGDYRILYTFDSEADEMVIRLVAHRSEIYDDAAGLG